jgi:hypothetical protein
MGELRRDLDLAHEAVAAESREGISGMGTKIGIGRLDASGEKFSTTTNSPFPGFQNIFLGADEVW